MNRLWIDSKHFVNFSFCITFALVLIISFDAALIMTLLTHDTTPIKTTRTKLGGGKRLSNIELLRIISMALVLLVHFVPAFKVTHHSLLNSPIKSVIFTELHSIAVVCVNCFIMISGYFGIRWKSKSFFSILYQVLFWLIIGFLVGELFLGITTHNLLSETVRFFSGRWFIPAYLGLYVLSPILNSFIEKCSEKQLGRFIIIFYIFSTIVGYLMRSAEFNEGMSVISLCGLYIIGGYLRRTNFKYFNLPSAKNLIIYLLLSIALTIVDLSLKYFSIEKSVFGYLNPIVIIMSIYLFLFFKQLNVKEIRIVNFIAASVFSVYLFHYHTSIVGFYNKICKEISDQGAMAAIWLPIFFLLIFALCISIDQIRIYSFKAIYKLKEALQCNNSQESSEITH